MRRDTVRLPDGSAATREYVIHPGAVVIVGFLDTPGCTRLLVEWQYRYPVEQTMFEFPAGKIDSGESQIDCAVRELQEETGYRASEWAPAGVVYPAIGYSTEFIGIWFARNMVAGAPALDEGEFVDVRSTTLEELLQACADGRVTDGKTLACISYLQNMLSGRWVPDWQNEAHWRIDRQHHRAMPRVARTLQADLRPDAP